MKRIRACESNDIPALVEIRRAAFAHSVRPGSDELARYFQTIFFENPWVRGDMPSLVYLDDDDRVGGFLGVIPRTAFLGTEPIMVAVGTQLMVRPNLRGLAGSQLLNAFFSGPQELSLADCANDSSRALWHSLGGRTSLAHSLRWTRAVRPLTNFVATSAGGVIKRAAAAAAKPLTRVIDAIAGRPHADPSLHPTETTDEEFAACTGRCSRTSPFVFHTMSARSGGSRRSLRRAALPGALRRVVLRDRRNAPVGWFWYSANRGGVGEVVQVVAAAGNSADVLGHLVLDAWEHGVVALSGSLEPHLVPALASRATIEPPRGPWTLLHSKHAAVLNAIENADCYLSRLDGEWWVSF